ncbi:hypothetical protein BV22DRAFT_1051872 [Leucogyrophana mollusca]|uniref:Uncharacterized protein n=1 Tax=Leucogyrophana mollusca TaxID=85980 RepID=A0ACB8AYI6_9AGAM|nr:hypothetical protein BV22DRAFT_1051872 [Leucogyrophana mollusca]
MENASSSSQTLENTREISLSITAQANQVEACLDAIKQFKHGDITYADVLKTIHNTLVRAVPDDSSTDPSFKGAFSTYLGMLDAVNSLHWVAVKQGKGTNRANEEEETEGRGPGMGEEETEDSRANKETEVVEESQPKHWKVDKTRFVWIQPDTLARARPVDPIVQQTINALSNWANNPFFVRSRLLLAPGCPDFPADQWLNICRGNVIDLDKVFTTVYTTDLKQKQTHDIGDFQISLKVEWLIAYAKYVRALTFIMPWVHEEQLGYQEFIIQSFTAISVEHHLQVIEFDKACQLQVSHQKHLRLNHISNFNDLQTVYLTSYVVTKERKEDQGDVSLVTIGTEASAVSPLQIVSTSIVATSVDVAEPTNAPNAPTCPLAGLPEPKYKQGMVW